MNIIGVAGQMQNGKSTAADYLALKLDWKQTAFAAPIKRIFCDAFGVDAAFVEKWKTNTEPPEGFHKTVRQSLQFIGDGFREIRPDVWIAYLFRANAPPYVISDGRYVNELRAVKDHGGCNLLVYRPDMVSDDPNGSESQLRPAVDYVTAQSFEGPTNNEPALQFIDYVIRNDGTTDELYEKLDCWVSVNINAF